MSGLSFVIPTLNEGAGLTPLLDDLKDKFPGAERIVVDGGSTDDTVACALRDADTVLLGAAGRARQMNLGASVAAGPYVCFLHADTFPAFDDAALLRAMDGARWGVCRVHLRGSRRSLRVIAAFMNMRSRLSHVATGDQMLIVERSFFHAQGGFADIPLMEDVEICKRLRRQAPPRVLSLAVSTSGRRWESRGVVSTVVLMWSLRLAYWLGVSPGRLWRYYYGDGDSGADGEAGASAAKVGAG